MNWHLDVTTCGQTPNLLRDRYRVDTMMLIEITDGAGLAKMLDPKGNRLVTRNATNPCQCGRVAVDCGYDFAMGGKRAQQAFDM